MKCKMKEFWHFFGGRKGLLVGRKVGVAGTAPHGGVQCTIFFFHFLFL